MNGVNTLQSLRAYYDAGNTRPYAFRMEQLKKLRSAVIENEAEIYTALQKDLNKSKEECWITENGILLSEINEAIKKLKKWMRPRRVRTNLLNFPSSSFIYPEPRGVSLIIGPWNYPFQLVMIPLVGSMAAGNCTVLKPSEWAVHTTALIQKIISSCFSENYIRVIEGDGAGIIPAMMNTFTFDHVFFTGSTAVGKKIYRMAAEKLVPVTLELGGKSPCIIEADANIEVSAKRIASVKFSNSGQMCIAPDYVLVHESIQEKWLQALEKVIQRFYGNPQALTYELGNIINQKQFDRLVHYLQDGEIKIGGHYNREQLFIAPTVLTHIPKNAPILQEEIFGPILPVISFKDRTEALQMIEQNPNPLSLYIFSNKKSNTDFWIQRVSFGGGCINNTGYHFTNKNLPFGGRGQSGMGSYHGYFSFKTFSHLKSIMKTPTWFDPAIKYPPYKGKLNLFKKVLR
ncbi:MAG: aldehyde dehydrogenase [Niastella sp. SCN 39-18]|nr:aldehyde dehydrogenase [Sphingobacteriales bacterium]ODT54178.1 MAG: aldehyde dehydrogenase [Niastella sp. SCN 39-18]OJW09555.1 MAG: aldehyde dehydrogenase family protein [Sphingobacteriales bacterium 39-19]